MMLAIDFLSIKGLACNFVRIIFGVELCFSLPVVVQLSWAFALITTRADDFREDEVGGCAEESEAYDAAYDSTGDGTGGAVLAWSGSAVAVGGVVKRWNGDDALPRSWNPGALRDREGVGLIVSAYVSIPL